jgi:rhamnose utilization protein RhaD (predicted bifunctional aldolase and dehydrogenase)
VLTPANQWADPAPGQQLRRHLMHRARLLAADIRVLNPGGGNFSVKERIADHLRRPAEVMWISGWGCDGALLTEGELACLRVDDVRRVRGDASLSNESMFSYLSRCALSAQPYPAIEALLHAYLRASHVDHTHPEAVIALTAVDAGRDLASKAFGAEAIWVDYEQFSPAFADRMAAEIDARPQARFLLLANHGLLTWADTSEGCYRNTIEAATRAAEALQTARSRPADLGGAAVRPLSDEEARRYLIDVMPTIRGHVSSREMRMVLRVDPDSSARSFVSSRRGPRLSAIGPACPDSLIKMKRVPAVVEASVRGNASERRLGATRAIAAYRGDYLAYWRRHAPDAEPDPPAGADLPRVFVIPGVGVVSAGENAYACALAEAHYRQTRRVITVADSVGGYSSLSEAQAYADEYWPLLRDKPQLQPPRGDLAGHIVMLVLDAADGSAPADALVRCLTQALLTADAHVVVVSSHGALVPDLAHDVRDGGIASRGAQARLCSDSAGHAVSAATLAFGGLDVVIHLQASAHLGADLVAAASEVFAQQGWSGHYIATQGSAERAAELLRALRAQAQPAVVPHVVVMDPGRRRAERKAAALRGAIAVARTGFAIDGLLTPAGDVVLPQGSTA